MLLNTKGFPHLIQAPVVGKVTRDPNALNEHTVLISEDEIPAVDLSNFSALMTNIPLKQHIDMPSVYSVGTFDHLSEGDIIVLNTDGHISTLYRPQSYQNFLLLTDRCNSNCLMCSQPPKNKDDSYLLDIYKQLIPLIPKDCQEIGLTGGEPTLLGQGFFDLLSWIKEALPDTDVHCLTNGRSFGWSSVTDRLAALEYRKLMLGIPLYSDHYRQHDYIVQARDAFHQTMQGFYKLAQAEQRIEIRVVLHQQTIPRLVKLAWFIYKNLPFAEHVTFMGLEYQGYTPHNIQRLWIDPVDYMNELSEAVYLLSDMGMHVSIYNLQLCLLPPDLWKFTRKSISDWKNIYLEECNKCALKEQCGGLFASAKEMHSSNIKAFQSEDFKK